MTPLYIIPARGGSKGIPRKNIKPLCGRPLIAYTIDVALAAQKVTGGYILLSTDDAEIASVARQYGLKTDYMRPADLGGDAVGSREVMLDAMDWATSKGISFDCVVLLQPTSPLRTLADVLNAEEKYSSEIDMVVSVCASDANPYYNLFELKDDGLLVVSKGNGLLKRRQDAPPVYEYNGAVYVVNPQSLREVPLGAFPRRIPCLMPRERSLDLDTPLDWEMAEYRIKNIDKAEK
ncbi:MAG: acylneuraminate cytidylyltransferase family protein [Muribaculaceae bacterium]|nr:acylneuraminate cytidylyltransferase family protein [Muribaculaceae bacterium]